MNTFSVESAKKFRQLAEKEIIGKKIWIRIRKRRKR
jgi:hypothetical protein